MTKKFLSRLICLVLVVNCFVGLNFSKVSATNGEVSVTYARVIEIIDNALTALAAMPKEDRFTYYYDFEGYFRTDNDLDNLIDIIVNIGNPESEVSQKILRISPDFINYKNEAILALNFIKSIDEDSRSIALDNFIAKNGYNGLTTSEKTALQNVYEKFVGGDLITALEDDHQITDLVLLNLFSCIKGHFVLTDSPSDISKLALRSVDSAFATRLTNNLSTYFTTVNGVSINTSKPQQTATNILNNIINLVNANEASSVIADAKSVFGGLDMYVKYTPVTNPPSGGNGGSPSIKYPNPALPFLIAPAVIPAPDTNSELMASISNFSDFSSSHWAASYVAELSSRNIFNGYDDGEFKPEQGITRQEVAVALVRALGLEARLENIQPASFIDSDEIGDWSIKSISLLIEMKIFTGYEDNSFKPKNIISRQEFAAIIARATTKISNGAMGNFTDKDLIESWAKNSIDKVYALGIVKGYEDNTFRPNNSVTRAEVATMLYNFMYTENLL